MGAHAGVVEALQEEQGGHDGARGQGPRAMLQEEQGGHDGVADNERSARAHGGAHGGAHDDAALRANFSPSLRRQAVLRKARRIMRDGAALSRQAMAASHLNDGTGENDINLASLTTIALDVRRTATALASSELFADLGDRQLSMLASSGVRQRHSRYSVLYREGASSSCYYVLVSGRLSEHALGHNLGADLGVPLPRGPSRPLPRGRERRVVACTTGAYPQFVLFGTEALFGRPRASTISALETCDVLKFHTSDLSANLRKDGYEKVQRILFDMYLATELEYTTPAFEGAPQRVLRTVGSLLVVEEVEAGTQIYGAGNPGDKVYFLADGTVHLHRGNNLLHELTAAEGRAASQRFGLPMFGENALLDRRPRSHAAVTLTDCRLLVLPLENFASLTLTIPNIKQRLRTHVHQARRGARRRSEEAA